VALAALAIGLLGIRIALPYFVRDYVNRTLHAMESYDGSIGGIDLDLWRGAYQIHDLRIDKRGAAERTVPFLRAEVLDLSIEWSSLLHGDLVGEAEFVRPDLNFIEAKDGDASQTGQGEDWPAQLEELFPFRFNVVRVRDGRVTFRAPGIQARDAITAEQVNGELVNLTNVVESGREAFAQFNAGGRVLGDAPVRVRGALAPFAREPTFDVNLELTGVDLPEVNPWLREYIKADAEAGRFQLYLELAAADGKFKGYAKPILEGVEVYSSDEAEKNPLRRIWEGLVEFAAKVFENDEADQVAARIPFSGTIRNPKAGTLETIVSVLRNAFVSAFARSLEDSISLRDVKKKLKKIRSDERREQAQ
jgi:hypothetical protein